MSLRRLVSIAVVAVAAAVGGGAAAVADGSRPMPAVSVTPASASASAAAAQPAAKAALQFVVGDAGVVRLPAETTTLTVSGVAGLDQLTAAELMALARSLSVVDRGVARGTPTAAALSFPSPPEFIGRSGANGLAWRIAVKADIPAGTSQVRIAQLTFGAAKPEQYAVEFILSAKAPGATPWTPRGATDVWTVSWSDKPRARVYAITIENPDEPLANLRLVQSTLKDAAGHTLGVERMQLLAEPDANAAPASLDVPGNSTRKLFLRLEDGAAAGPYGTFDGVVRFAVDGSAATKDVPLKVQASSTWRRWLGFGAAAVGLGLTILVHGLARPRMARLQARRAVAALRQALARFDAERDSLAGAVKMPIMAEASRRLATSISDDTLDDAGLLPRGFALAPAFDALADTAAALGARLEEVSKRLEGLLILLRAGLPPLLRPLGVEATRLAAQRLLDELDGFASQVTGVQDARAKADDVAHRAQALQGAELAAPDMATPARSVSVAGIDFQIRSLSDLMWIVWALVALMIAGGWIAADADYGTTLDLVASFAWGFGMTTFGAGIQNLTPGSVAAQLKVKLPS